jgi:NAD(P)H-dependent FMN reductase
MHKFTAGYFVGSLARGSINRKLAVALARLARRSSGCAKSRCTAVAQQHLRSILAFCNSPLMNLIEAYIQFEPGLITDDGEFTVESTRDFLRTYMTEFYGFITRVYTVLPRGGA